MHLKPTWKEYKAASRYISSLHLFETRVCSGLTYCPSERTIGLCPRIEKVLPIDTEPELARLINCGIVVVMPPRDFEELDPL